MASTWTILDCDSDKQILTEADIKVTTKFASSFRNQNFRKSLFETCKLRETMPFRNGRMTRAEHLQFRNETGWRQDLY